MQHNIKYYPHIFVSIVVAMMLTSTSQVQSK